MSEYDIAIKIAGKLEGSFRNAIKGAQSGLTGLGLSGKVGTMALKGIGVAAKATAAALTATGAAAVAMGGYAVSVGKDFESQMSTVQSISGATGEEFDKLQAKAKQMGSTTAFSATEAGQAMEYMAMAGWKTEDMIAGIDGVMNLAAATGEDLATTSDIVTDALTAFGLTAQDTQGFVDDLAQAARNSNTDVSMMGESFKQAATAAGALGYDTKDVAVALGAMANNGIKGEKSGTMLAKMFSRMSGTNSNATKAMKKLDLSMFNADGSAKELSTVLSDMRDRFSGLTQAEKENYAYMLGGQSAMNGILAIVNTSEEDWSDLANAIEHSSGAAAEMAAIKLDNLEGDITLLKSATEGFGISLYENMKGPLRDWVKYGKDQIGVLQTALDEGGFEGLAGAIGDVLANGVTKIADAAPGFINAAADIVEALVDGIDGKSPELGAAMTRLGTALIQAAIRLAPKMITTGGTLMVEFAKGMMDNLPALKESGKEAVSYLWETIKSAFKEYKDFLGDDSAEPFKRWIAAIPALVGGFALLDGVGGTIKGFVSGLKGAGKAMSGAAKGFGAAGKSMSAAAKNIAGIGAGIALAATGIWLLVNAARAIAEAGPDAQGALIAMGIGLVAVMAIASKMGPQLTAASNGLLAFGAAVLMTAAGMIIMSYAAIQLANAGPMAFASLALMIGGMAGLMAIAGAFGASMAAATPGLLAFGAAIILTAAGMSIMAFTAVQLAQAGTGAIAMFAGLAVALIAFMAVAALLGPMLVTGGAGMLLLGAGLLIAAAGMALLANTAIQLSAAGAPALIMMAALAVGILAFGAAAGALAPLLVAGGVALAAFGAGLLIVSTAAVVAGAALLIISASLPMLSEYGSSGAAAIVELGVAMTGFSVGAVAAGAGATASATGFTALAVAAAAADLAFAPLVLEVAAVAAALVVIGASSAAAGSGLETMKGSADGIVTSMAKVAAGFVPVTAAIVPFAAGVAAGTVAVTAMAASVTATDLALAALVVELLAVSAELMVINLAISTFMMQTGVLSAGVNLAVTAFRIFGAGVDPMAQALLHIVSPMTAAGAASTVLAGSMTKSAASGKAMAITLVAMTAATAAGVVAFRVLLNTITTSMTQAQNTAQAKSLAIVSIISMSGTQIIIIATNTAYGVRNAFNIDLTAAGVQLMQGLINGMNSMAGAVQATAGKIANQAAQAVNNALKIHSPSQVMIESGQYTGEGLALGMQNRSGDIQAAATAMTQPVQEQGRQMREISAPEYGNRSAVIGETIDTLSGNTTNNSTTNNQTVNPTFNYNPTFVIQGNADQNVIKEANKTSQDDFERMMSEWMRKNQRVQFA